MADNQNLQQPLKIGEELTQYKIEKVLGKGGFGITYLAMDLNLERQVVIKEFFPREQVMRSSGSEVQVLSAGSGNGIYKNSLKRFLAEGRTLAKFRHDNIALVLTAFPENNTAYLVMEYNKGEDLAEFIKKRNRSLDFTQIKKIFLPICKGLQALHKQGLLHLDIKPDNIYLPDKGEPYLIDFGGIRQFIASKDVSASFMVLTPGYAPAEQHSNTSKLGFYSDIYALGMTIYYALTLDKALPQSTDRQQSIFEGDDDPLPLLADSVITKNYPKGFIALIEQSIQPNRKHRLQKIDDLIGVLVDNKIKSKKAKTAQANNQTRQISPLIKEIASILMILIFIGLVLWQIQQRRIQQADATLYQHAKTASTISSYESYLDHCTVCEDKEQAQMQITIIKQPQNELKGWTLHKAAEENNLRIAKLLIAKGANVNAEDNDGRTPLHKAAWYNATETARLLIAKDASVNAKNNKGFAPLHGAAWNNATETARLLIAKGANVNAEDNDGWTPLHSAAWKNATETAKLLIAKGANVNAENNNGWTPLHYAAASNATKTAKLLIDRGADVNDKSNGGWTPLHYAARKNATETAKLLIAKGANVNANGNSEETPLYYAEEYNNTETANLLRAHGGHQ